MPFAAGAFCVAASFGIGYFAGDAILDYAAPYRNGLPAEMLPDIDFIVADLKAERENALANLARTFPGIDFRGIRFSDDALPDIDTIYTPLR